MSRLAHRTLLALLAAALAGTVHADEVQDAPPQPKPVAKPAPKPAADEWAPTDIGDRFSVVPTPLADDKGVFETWVTHRFFTSVREAGGTGLLGLDRGNSAGIGMMYVPVKNVALQLYRTTYGGDYEIAGKITALRPSESFPIGIGVRGGINWLTEDYVQKQSSGFGQLLISATIGDRVTLGFAPGYTQRTPSGLKSVFNVPVALQLRVTNSIALIGEYVPRWKHEVADGKGQWSFVIQKSVYRHKFALWIGNSGASTVDQVLAGDYAGGVTESNIRIGFNLLRQFDIAAD